MFSWLGLSVAAVTADDRRGGGSGARRDKYAADITYVTGQELAFTYLFDNSDTCRSPAEQVRASCCCLTFQNVSINSMRRTSCVCMAWSLLHIPVTWPSWRALRPLLFVALPSFVPSVLLPCCRS